MRVHSFPPISDSGSRLLILGSMPGKASLRAGQYYAHPRNAFWKIMSTLLQIDAAGPYENRLAALRQHGIALWDVLKSCTRESSLDSDVVESSVVVNEFPQFLRAHPRIHTVCFNGAKAEGIYRRHALPGLTKIGDLTYHRLPSTSPANASVLYARKVAAWRTALGGSVGRGSLLGCASARSCPGSSTGRPSTRRSGPR